MDINLKARLSAQTPLNMAGLSKSTHIITKRQVEFNHPEKFLHIPKIIQSAMFKNWFVIS